MGADLFGSFAESTCAALVISSTTLFASEGIKYNHEIYLQNLMFPLILTAIGIIVSLITSAIGIYINKVDVEKKI
jgi:inorganic pyrophosphatase